MKFFDNLEKKLEQQVVIKDNNLTYSKEALENFFGKDIKQNIIQEYLNYEKDLIEKTCTNDAIKQIKLLANLDFQARIKDFDLKLKDLEYYATQHNYVLEKKNPKERKIKVGELDLSKLPNCMMLVSSGKGKDKQEVGCVVKEHKMLCPIDVMKTGEKQDGDVKQGNFTKTYGGVVQAVLFKKA